MTRHTHKAMPHSYSTRIKKHLNSLILATESLLDGNQLSLTYLGYNFTGSVEAKHLGWQKDFQANSIKHRAALSVVELEKKYTESRNTHPFCQKSCR
jgi:hypothetical protein